MFWFQQNGLHFGVLANQDGWGSQRADRVWLSERTKRNWVNERNTKILVQRNRRSWNSPTTSPSTRLPWTFSCGRAEHSLAWSQRWRSSVMSRWVGTGMAASEASMAAARGAQTNKTHSPQSWDMVMVRLATIRAHALVARGSTPSVRATNRSIIVRACRSVVYATDNTSSDGITST